MEKQKNNIFYHVANPIFRKNILARGLIPFAGESQKDMHTFYRKRIFLKNKNDYDSTWDDDRYEVRLPKDIIRKLRVDKEIENSFYLDNIRVNKKYIKLIYKGTGESTF